MFKRILAMAICICAISASCVYADAPNINAEGKMHKKHIKQGIKSGKISKPQSPQVRHHNWGEKQPRRALVNKNAGNSPAHRQDTPMNQNTGQNSK
jgi:hypothetical protein